MPRLKSASPSERMKFSISPENASELSRRYSDPTNAYGSKYGERSRLVNMLLSRYFRDNPVASLKELETLKP